MRALAIIAALALASPPVAAATETAPYVIERSLVATVTGPDGHPYRITAAWPDTPPPPAGWPVLYVLDGDDNFAATVMTARRLARAGARSGVEAGVVVGIDSGALPRRVLDYTPATPGYAIPAGAPAHGLATGGADAFLDVIEQQVKPFVARRWKVDAGRQALLGHSFGAVTVLHALFKRPGLATTYLAVSPSLWFGNGLVEREAGELAAGGGNGATVLIAAGTDERGPGGAAVPGGEALTARLQAKGAAAHFLSLSGQGHGGTMYAALADAAALAFRSAGTRP